MDARRALHDSGYTLERIEGIVDGLLDQSARDKWGEQAGMFLALALELLPGDAIEISDSGTVMLPSPRDAIDARTAAVRQRLASGATLLQALQDHAPAPPG